MTKLRTMMGAAIPIFALAMLAGPRLAQAHNTSRIVLSGPSTSGFGISITSLPSASSSPAPPRLANFLGEKPSRDARHVADWVVASGDNDGLSFIIVDKLRAKVFVFDSGGQLLGATSALLGLARGDDSAPGIGNEKLSSITPEERTTPAGRFVAESGHDLENDVLWIDYDNSLALHRVVRGRPSDHRLHRLATSSSADKRITYGCVEVSIKFYDDIVHKNFSGKTGIIYILPEIKTVQDVFPELGSPYPALSKNRLRTSPVVAVKARP